MTTRLRGADHLAKYGSWPGECGICWEGVEHEARRWPILVHLPADWKSHRNAALFALALSCAFAMPGFGSLLFGVSVIATGIGLYVTPLSLGRIPVAVALAVILLSTFVAVPGSVWWGEGHWVETLGIALWMLPAAGLYLANLTERVFAWLVPAFLIHAGAVIYSGLFDVGHHSGMTFNPNLAAGFLVIGIVYLLPTRYRLLALPLFGALVLTESRWALAVCIAIVAGQMLADRTRRQVLVAAVGLALVAILVLSMPSLRYWHGGGDRVGAQLVTRLSSPTTPGLVPAGVVATDGLHNTPSRIAVESGLVAAVLWVGLGGWALCRRRRDSAWWLLLALLALAMMDYYPWMGHLGGLWWLAVGLRTKRPATALINPHKPPGGL